MGRRKCWKNEYLTLLEGNNGMMMPRLATWVQVKICLEWVRPTVFSGWGTRWEGNVIFEGAVSQREWMKPCAWRKLERWGAGTIWKETWGTSSSKGKEEEEGTEKSSEQPSWGGTGRWSASEGRLTLTGRDTSGLQGRLREMGQDLRPKSVRRTRTSAGGEQLGIKEQETKGRGGVWGLRWGQTVGFAAGLLTWVRVPGLLWPPRNQHPSPGLWDLGRT